jgi:hypothetical protein
LKLKFDELLSNFAFNFNLRRYSTMQEFGVVLRGFLPDVLRLISPSSEDVARQLVVDFLARVLLTHASSVKRRETEHNHISILARQLATAAVADNQCFESTPLVGPCRLTVSKPELKAQLVSALETEI